MIFRHYLFANITEAPKSRSDIEENREMSNWTACPVRVLLHKKNTIFETVTILFFIYLQMTIIQVGYYYYIQYYDRVQIQYLRTT